MRLLLCLVDHAGEVISIEDLLNQVWGKVNVSQDSIYQAVASLRRQLGDDPKQPSYIETVPRLGYRMVATVSAYEDESVRRPSAGAVEAHSAERRTLSKIILAAVVICLVLAVPFLFLWRRGATNKNPSAAAIAAASQSSIAVLPFLDLTEGMKEEEFADGMTEELIDKLSKMPGLRVPAPTSSFYFKGKQVQVGEIAKALGVAYVLDGSVRKSGATLRVATRLVRADNGYVMWTETYDRPFNDVLVVQDDIAREVTKTLRAAIKADSGSSESP
jgi:TolB-like protein/DNA-binding winged helix-turn-helix (wHTH) protein